MGNRQTDATASYTYDTANRLLSRGGVGYTWDASGNLVGKTDTGGTATYRYDGDNRLREVQQGGAALARFTYDPFGRRASKTTSAGTIYYIYDGQDLLAEIDAAGNLLSYYVFGPDIDEQLALVRDQQIYFYHADALGTVTHLTNQSGLAIQSYEFDGFGKILQQTGSLNQAYTFLLGASGMLRSVYITTGHGTTIPSWGSLSTRIRLGKREEITYTPTWETIRLISQTLLD